MEETRAIDENLARFFRKRTRISESEILTTFGFLNEKYVSNFGLLAPTRISASLNAIKARLLDLETFKKSRILVKPERFGLIVGTPSLEDPTLPYKSIRRLKESIDLIEEITNSENISFFRAESPKAAAGYLVQQAA